MSAPAAHSDDAVRAAIAIARRLRGRQTQKQLADALTQETGEQWSRVMVTKLESGDKELTVDTLMAIARIHDLPCSFYLEPMPGAAREAKGLLLGSSVLVAA